VDITFLKPHDQEPDGVFEKLTSFFCNHPSYSLPSFSEQGLRAGMGSRKQGPKSGFLAFEFPKPASSEEQGGFTTKLNVLDKA
jgi:hypothetical protein